MDNINRRKFIGTAALAGIGLAGAGAIISGCKKNVDNKELGLPPVLRGAPTGKKLRAALVGAGARGTGAAINFISSGPDLEIVAVADICSRTRLMHAVKDLHHSTCRSLQRTVLPDSTDIKR